MPTTTTTTTTLRNNPGNHGAGAAAGLDLFPRPPRTAYDLYRVGLGERRRGDEEVERRGEKKRVYVFKA